ncbi:hypothetical protein L6452_09681 [Arctium lappa]|uniref:Uncharacterized protein n=1 Tax=Arctium lappa TaxID=4217 RepID=A0ACB9DKQ0_ARCLA|nr:hypothetical protein L6452_09681 [Arctium lappa]
MVQILIVPLLPFPLYHTPLSLHSPHHSIDFDFSLAVFSINSGDRLQQLRRSSPSLQSTLTCIFHHLSHGGRLLPRQPSPRQLLTSVFRGGLTIATGVALFINQMNSIIGIQRRLWSEGCLVAMMASVGPSPGSSPCWPSSPAQMNSIIVCISGSVKMMRIVESVFTIMILLGLLVTAKSEVYIVTIEGESVISYKGCYWEATAVESDEKLDVTSDLVTLHRTPATLNKGMIRFLKHCLIMDPTRSSTATSILSTVLLFMSLWNRSQSGLLYLLSY